MAEVVMKTNRPSAGMQATLLVTAALAQALSTDIAFAAAEKKAQPSPASAPEAKTAPPANVEQRNKDLLKQHTEIWGLMGLSKKAQDELNGIVVSVNKQIAKNKAEHPGECAKVADVKRADHPLNREEYVANHKKRFDFLKISEPTQKELFGAADFVWGALHAPDASKKYTAEQQKTAGIIRDMMKKMNGPPPCCDDNIFARAKVH
jgi:hypothetical protein